MKKSLSWVIGALAMVASVDAGNAAVTTRAKSTADLSGAPATRVRENVNYEKYKTRTTTKTYSATDAGDLYYTKPANRNDLYKQYQGTNSANAAATKTTVRKTRAETTVSKLKRKYFLAHPFFQPLGEKFGSITDLSYTSNSYDFVIDQTLPVFSLQSGNFENVLDGIGATWKTDQISIKEDFSYGITDRVAILGMLRYDMSDYKFEWDDGSPDDTMEDDGLNMFGIGAQWRFADTEDWIAMTSAYFQHQKDISNNFLLEVKGGYKVARSTIYGLARGWYIDLDGNSYGNGITGTDAAGNKSTLYIPYQVGDSSAIYLEAGAGVFSVLNEDWTLNVEAVYGNYDWHNQASIRGAIGWQPNDWFALNLYAKTVFYDNANDKTLDLYWREPNVTAQAPDGTTFNMVDLTRIGTVKLDNYAETTVGLQAIFQF